ncbi:hypothetical protein LTR10_015437 [Elasticomyces elasticus]|uniref:SMP-30/Gluconolactonase/LRE-like region domain-containing protein n=1 Tax=Exophiala sideris TaxID=1016849 RepID=A0ABR0J3T9_9EURO|nr:hypothetical protein LTR10_015437 [Elasticomyces elasticus]KAK5026971.1 hypothetical protein LTS07_007270 [Exophiala sideris]KAK5033975.1 hypothetical protein LTR13_006575 [Exophiala sideris]KAK5055751.1 hypothetical protein LTR69_008126 [Exophiala sideris]KAK5180917.1 hypothetical protein LTR44_006737 [Eurotiomycetes sp. CCFEE 6388]
MHLLSALSLAAATCVYLSDAAPLPTAPTTCPPLQGSFNVSLLDLYPESADWDPIHCKIYFGLYYNASVAVYDPYKQVVDEIITFPNITNNPDYTITGIDYSGNGSMYFAATSYTAFRVVTTGNAALANFTGPNAIIKYDLTSHSVSWTADLVPIHNSILNATGKLVTGFQDMAEDTAGNAYVIGSFGEVIVKIDPSGTPKIWYQPATNQMNDTLISGGLVVSGSKLVINDRAAPGLLTFDLSQQAPNGTAPGPVLVSPTNFPANYTGGADALVAPSKYDGNVVLWSQDFNGTMVLATRDNWVTAEYLGLVPMNPGLQAQGAYTTDTFAMGNTIYAVNEFFQPSKPIKTLSDWHLDDITQSVQQLVNQWNMTSKR